MDLAPRWVAVGLIALASPACVGSLGASGDDSAHARATETVWCADGDGLVDERTVRGHDGPVTDLDVRVVGLEAGAVSDRELLDACDRWPEWARWARLFGGGTVCAAWADPASIERYAASALVAGWDGPAGPDRPGFPVVVRGTDTCEGVRLQTGPDTVLARTGVTPIADRLGPWPSVERFNAWRAAEDRWRDAADGSCLDVEAARALAARAQHDLDGDWPIVETAHDPEHPGHAGLCLDVRLERGGYIVVAYHHVETPGGRSGPVGDVVDEAAPDAPGGP
ncbi:MAG: hypothetical protein JJT89_05495 [Nitriliruptoraceae bacterium]|nr:hypothetical protein [Nitriliruptoraceae bacterium]